MAMQEDWTQGESWVDPTQKPELAPAEQSAQKPVTQQAWTRQNVMDAIKGFAPTREGLDAAIKANPWLGQQVGSAGGKIYNAQTGQTWDVIKNISSGNGSWQTLTGNTARAAAAAAAKAPAAPTGLTVAPPVAAPAPPPPAPAPTAPAEQPMAAEKAALIKQLMERMQQTLKIDPRTDPIMRNQTDTYAAGQNRERRNYLNEQAERLSARGLGASGAVQNERRMADEQSAQNVGQFESELVGREIMARRQEIQHALDSMGNLLTEQERQALQRELAAADNALKRYGIDTQNSQYFAGLGQADRHFAAQLSQADRLAGQDNAFRYAQLGQQDSQFRDQMGFNMADRQAYWDAQRRGQL